MELLIILKTCCYVTTGCIQALSNFVSCQFTTTICFLLLFYFHLFVVPLPYHRLFGNWAMIIVLLSTYGKCYLNFPHTERNNILKWKMFFGHAAWGLGIGHATSGGQCVLLHPPITDLFSNPLTHRFHVFC